jgi:two-component system, sensor histidine kinase and response regulator
MGETRTPLLLPQWLLFLPIALVTVLIGAINLYFFYAVDQARSANELRELAFNERLQTIHHFVHSIHDLQYAVMAAADSNAPDTVVAPLQQLFELQAKMRPLERLEQGISSPRPPITLLFAQWSEKLQRVIDNSQRTQPPDKELNDSALLAFLALSRSAQTIVLLAIDEGNQQITADQQRIRQLTRHLAISGAITLLLLLALWLLFSLRFGHRIAIINHALQGLIRGESQLDELDSLQKITQNNLNPLATVAKGLLAFRQVIIERQQNETDLGERIKESNCLYDIFRLTEGDTLSTDAMLIAIIARLPAAMRYPEEAVASILYQQRHYGEVIEGPVITAPFRGSPDHDSQISVGYRRSLATNERSLFLDEEQRLLDVVAGRLADILERRRVVAIDRENRALLRAVVDEAPDAIDLIEADDLRFVEVNQASCRLLGYSRNELLQLNLMDVVADRHLQHLAALQQRLLTLGGGEFETRYLRKDGGIIDVRIRLRNLQRDHRDYFITIWRDVTAEKATASTINRLSLVVEQSPTLIVITDLTARIEFVNDAFLRTTGYQRFEVLGRNPSFLQSGKTPITTYSQLWAKLLRGETWRGEFINLTRDGRELWVSATIVPLHQPNGEISHYVALKEDITLRRAQEERLRKLSLAVEQSPESIVITDLKVNIEYVNEAFLRSSGYQRDEVIGKNPRILQSGLTPTETYRQMWQCLSRGEAWSGELINRRKDGTHYTEIANLAPIRQDDGSVSHFLAIKQDITEQKRILRELEAYRANLEQLVAERTAQMQEAKEAAEVASRSKSEFLANMSHEIRTPMNAIIGLTHLLRREVSDQRQILRIDKITDAAHHLLGIINDILDLSRIEAGRLTIETIDFEIERVLENVINMTRVKAENRGIELVVDLRSLPPILHGDGLRIGQVLLNLAGNAVKFTEQGSVTLRATILTADDCGLRVRFEVSDTGIGLSPEQQSRLFNNFEQADASTTRKYGGSGLGLAISQRLVTIMGGTIGVESTLGEGSTFWFEIPLGYGHLPPPPRSVIGQLHGLRALVVDDLADARESISDILTHLGLQVTSVSRSSSALEELHRAEEQNNPYHLLLADWQMPGIDGLELGRQITQLALKTPPLRFLMTAWSETLPREAIARSGYGELLVKPLTPSLLRAVLQRSMTSIAPQGTTIDSFEIEEKIRMLPSSALLLVEDNPINQEVTLDLLAGVEIIADLAQNGAEALAMAKKRQYDLILMDIQMPIMGGIEATQAIRRLPNYQQTPIIAMTANAFDEDRSASLKAGMNDFLTKPVDPQRLFQTLLHWLPGQSATPALPPSPPPLRPPAILSTSELQRLEQIDGLDLESGMRFAGGRHELYQRMIGKFLASELPIALIQAITENDRAVAHRTAHTIKGVAATIGAFKLAAQSAQIEAAILASPSDAPLLPLQSSAEAFHKEFNQICEMLRHALTPPPTPTDVQAPQADYPQAKALSQELIQLLASDDMAATTFYQTHAPLLVATFGAKMQRIGRLIEQFAFDVALNLLQQLITPVESISKESHHEH